MPFPFPKSLKKRTFELLLVVCGVSLLAACNELRRSEPNPYLAESQPPPSQEFRWSNGRMPKSLDPALASAAPETDVVNALYEGLTKLDPKTLKAVPGAAEKWTASDDGKTWTFEIREDARWSNGKPVTSEDFVRSWQRVHDLGKEAAHQNLLRNFSRLSDKTLEKPASTPEDFVEPQEPGSNGTELEYALPSPDPDPSPTTGITERLAITAHGERKLTVQLKTPDPHFPELISHSVFRPVSFESLRRDNRKLDPATVTNGAFRIAEIGENAVALERSETYWNVESVKLEKVVFVASDKPDEALEAYRTGKVDAVTNAELSPLAQKVFSPYGDVRKSAYAALNFYEVNHRKAPFNDRRVREALAISIERERLMSGEHEATAQPAFTFLPFGERPDQLVQDKERARELLEQAGFGNGYGFPVVRITVNRNETQIRVARAVARMWKENLNVNAEVVIKESSEIDEIRTTGDFDVLRRGVVLPVPNELVCIAAIRAEDPKQHQVDTVVTSGPPNSNSNAAVPSDESTAKAGSQNESSSSSIPLQTFSEADALYELHAIPLYFPTSFALVKPFVDGFDSNSLDLVDLSAISINSNWRPAKR